jgi:hypothetical protein
MITVTATLLAMTAVSGIVDAVSLIALGHVFTANMTGNIVFLGFAIGGVAGLSMWRSLLALAFFMSGAVLGGWMTRTMNPTGLPLAMTRNAGSDKTLLCHRRASTTGESSHRGRASQLPESLPVSRPDRSFSARRTWPRPSAEPSDDQLRLCQPLPGCS